MFYAGDPRIKRVKVKISSIVNAIELIFYEFIKLTNKCIKIRI